MAETGLILPVTFPYPFLPATEVRRVALQQDALVFTCIMRLIKITKRVRFSFQLKYSKSGKQLKITLFADPVLALMYFFTHPFHQRGVYPPDVILWRWGYWGEPHPFPCPPLLVSQPFYPPLGSDFLKLLFVAEETSMKLSVIIAVYNYLIHST